MTAAGPDPADRLLDQLEDLTGWITRSTSSDEFTVDWADTAQALALVTASGLPVAHHRRTRLGIRTPGRGILVHAVVPGRELALLVAEAAITADRHLAAGQPLGPGPSTTYPEVRTLLDALTQTPGSVSDSIERIARRVDRAGPLGTRCAPTPVTDTLATLLLDSAGGSVAADMHADLADDALRTLARRFAIHPDYLDVARGLARDARITRPVTDRSAGRTAIE